MNYAKIKMELKYHLHIRTAAEESAANLLLCADHHCRPNGIWKNNDNKLVFRRI